MVMKSVVACGMIALLLTSCSLAAVKPALPPTPTPAFVTWSQAGEPAKRICVLPFADHTGTPGLAAQVRQSFAGHLSVKRFIDIELYEVDSRLSAWAETWKDQPVQLLGKALGCEALIYGEVTEAGRLYLGVYSQVALAGSIRMVETATGQTVAQSAHTTRFHAGGVPFSPIAVVANSLLNLRNIGDTQMLRVIDDLGRHLAGVVPDLPTPLPVQEASPTMPPATSPPTEIPQTASSRTATVQESYRLQVAAFRSSREAQQAARLLRDKGYRPAIAEFTEAEQPWHRVVLGPFSSFHEASQVGEQIQQSLPFSPVVTRTADR
jgi:hypothetical protein